AGGFTLEAAESIAGSPDGSSLEVIDGLAALIDQSLLQQHPTPDGEPRYQMLEIIREHAGEGLSNTGESEEIHRRHADHFLALAEAGEPHLAGAQQGEWLAQLDRERDNLRAALKWA